MVESEEEKRCNKFNHLKTRRSNGAFVCLPCNRITSKRLRDEDPERFRQYSMQYEDSKERMEYKKRYNKEHSEERTAKNREYHSSNPDRRKQSNKNYVKSEAYSITQKRYAHARRAAEGTFTSEEWQQIVTFQDGKCIDCGNEVKLTVGHLVPVSKNGSNWPFNIVGQCLPCNSRQSNKLHPLAGIIDEYRNVALRYA